MILAAVLWITAIVVLLWPGERMIGGTVKGADFAHFYTFGRAAATPSLLYDTNALHQLQQQLVPPSADDWFLPVYPPHTALIFAPYAALSYAGGATAWGLTTLILYAVLLRVCWLRVKAALPDGTFVAAAAMAFPPLWSLVLHGQTSIIPFSAFGLAFLALDAGRPFLAGMAFGLLAIKPQFAIVIAAAALVSRDWRMILGGGASVALQLAASAWWLGPDVIRVYVNTVRTLPEVWAALEPRASQMHSLKVLTDLLPATAGRVALAVGGVLVAAQAIRIWRAPLPLTVRMGVLGLASVLVNPHVTTYDVTVLALPLLWLGAWVATEADASRARRFWLAVYWLYPALAVPTALFLQVQLSAVLMIAILASVVGLALNRRGERLAPGLAAAPAAAGGNEL